MSGSTWSAVELFGASLKSSSTGDVKTEDALSNSATVKAIGIYFSAHWCPPCRGFTPKLAEYYKKDLKAKGLEIVFVSSDKDEAAFDSYFAEMPWLALPYADRKMKETLSKKYKVNGIPSFVIVDAKSGEIITKEGRGAVMEDPTGTDFPWIPKTLVEILESSEYIRHDENKDSTSKNTDSDYIRLKYSDFSGKKLGLYFSAHWCPPCRNFTPVLKNTYEKLVKENGEKFDIIFCSGDRSEEQFKEYFGTMPWKALPFENKKTESALSSHFGVSGIPCLVILDEDREVISKNAVGKVRAETPFPWLPALVNEIDANPEGINDHPSLIVFQEEMSAEKKASMAEMLKNVATWCKAQAKNGVEGMGEFIFFTADAKDGSLGSQIRGDCDLGEAQKDKVQAIVADVDDNMAFYNVETDLLASEESLKKFLQDYCAGKKPEQKQIKQ